MAEEKEAQIESLSEAFQKARKQLVLWSGILITWEVVGIDNEELDGTASILKAIDRERIPIILLFIVVYFAFRAAVEWFQNPSEKRSRIASRADFYTSETIGLAAVVLLAGTRLAAQIVQGSTDVSFVRILFALGPFLLGGLLAVFLSRILWRHRDSLVAFLLSSHGRYAGMAVVLLVTVITASVTLYREVRTTSPTLAGILGGALIVGIILGAAYLLRQIRIETDKRSPTRTSYRYSVVLEVSSNSDVEKVQRFVSAAPNFPWAANVTYSDSSNANSEVTVYVATQPILNTQTKIEAIERLANEHGLVVKEITFQRQ